MTKQKAIKILKSKMDGSVDTSYKWTEAVRMAIEALEQEPNPFCALADRECPFQGKEYAWCLTCPHISEEDRALVKKVASEPKRGKWIEDECYPYCVCNKCGQMCGMQNNGWCNYGARME